MRKTRYLPAFVLAASLLLIPAIASAQGGLSVWAGIGAAAQDGKATFSKQTKQLGLQLSAPAIPLGVRADAMMLGSGFDTDAISYNVNAVFRLTLPVVQPYALLGTGRYAVTPSSRDNGWNLGAGVRVGFGGLGVFAEVRHHDPIDRTITVAGVTF